MNERRERPDRNAGDRSDPAWEWFASRGPHGAQFTWSASRTGPPGFVGLELLRQVIEERTAAEPDFPQRVRDIALDSLGSSDSALIRRALQVLAVVGQEPDLRAIHAFTSDTDELVSGDAKASHFELKNVTLRR